MRSLLLALDDTPGGASAANFALSLAVRHNAAVTGASILDIDYLTAPEPGGIGTTYFKSRSDRARLKRGQDLTERLTQAFLKQCQARQIRGSVLTLEGRPWHELQSAAAAHDVIIIGRDSDLHGESDSGLAMTVEKILQENPRPLVVTPTSVTDSSRIVIAYDGSVPAARSLQTFTLLGLMSKCEVHVVSVATSQDIANRWVAHARAYLDLYDIACRTSAIASKANPADLVMAEAITLDAELVMMGAYGHRGWKETLLGSFTTRLLAESATALFIHH